eukprot:gene38214-46433_t
MSSMGLPVQPLRTVILGGGIHGACIAYYLATTFGEKPIIIERTRVAAAASGKAGGFLARDWGSGATVPLHQISYELHKELARKHHIESYREITTLEVDGNRAGGNVASWLDRKASSKIMDRNTAQVTPAEFTEKIMQAAVEQGAEVWIDSACGIEMSEDRQVTHVLLQNHGRLATDKVVLAMGPWSGVAVEDWFGLPLPMDGIKSTSLVFKRLPAILSEPYACFCAEDDNHCHLELYPRPNGDLYICGIGGSDYVRGDRLREAGDCAHADLVRADPARVTAAMSSLRSMSSMLDHAEAQVQQACMRPCTSDGLPVMGAIPTVKGAYISTGHNCWGILWAPVSGMCMAELISTGTSITVDLNPFSPDRYMIKGAKGRGRKKGALYVGEQW